MLLFLLFIFWIPLLIEGIGVSTVHFNILYTYFLIPSLLFFISIFVNKKLVFPQKASGVFSLFILFSLISSFLFSVDIEKSFELTVFYLSSFLIFIFFYNFKKEGKLVAIFSIFLGSIVFIVVNILFQFNIKLLPILNWPYNGYQLVVSSFGSHNHLGDFLGLTIILTTYIAVNKSRKILAVLILFLIPFFLLSFSRSSYNALLLTGVYYFLIFKKLIRAPKKVKLTFIILSIFILFFSFSITNESRSIPVLKSLNVFYTQQFNLQTKDLLARRPEYISEVLKSFYKSPFFGIGPGNFGYISEENRSPNTFWSETAHNIFFDVLAENGIFAFICLLFFIFLIIKSGIKSNSVYSLLFIYLLINFQTDYTYKIYSVFILFMILAGIIYKEDNEIKKDNLFGATSLILHSIFILIFASTIFLRMGNPEFAAFVYPLNKQAYPPAIKSKIEKGDQAGSIILAKKYEWLASNNTEALDFLGSFYQNINKPKALELLEKSNELDNYMNFTTVKNIYFFKRELTGKLQAREFLEKALIILKEYDLRDHFAYQTRKQIIDFCHETEKDLCSKYGF